MKKDSKQRLFEVTQRLDKTFKPKLSEEMMPTSNSPRPLYQIAKEIRQDWKNVYFGAVPYLQAMSTLDSINDNYMMDSAKSVVLYFLSNAGTWKGETAKRIKTELKQMAGLKEEVMGEEEVGTAEEIPQTEEQKWEEQVESYVNGNITDFANWLKSLEIGELIRFLRWSQENNVKF